MYHNDDDGKLKCDCYCVVSDHLLYYVADEDTISHERKYDLKVHSNGVQTVPGTCSYHSFIPDGDSLTMNRISSDTINDVHKFNDPKLLRNPTIYQPGKYNACYYDKIWYIGAQMKIRM